jgi:hypothetical protein
MTDAMTAGLLAQMGGAGAAMLYQLAMTPREQEQERRDRQASAMFQYTGADGLAITPNRKDPWAALMEAGHSGFSAGSEYDDLAKYLQQKGDNATGKNTGTGDSGGITLSQNAAAVQPSYRDRFFQDHSAYYNPVPSAQGPVALELSQQGFK